MLLLARLGEMWETHGELFLTGVYLLANTNENRKMLDERNH